MKMRKLAQELVDKGIPKLEAMNFVVNQAGVISGVIFSCEEGVTTYRTSPGWVAMELIRQGHIKRPEQ